MSRSSPTKHPRAREGVGLLLLLSLLSILFPRFGTADEENYVLATGGEGGLYHRVGVGISVVARESDPPIELTVTPSTGSLENLERLNTGRADLALIQGDIVQTWLGVEAGRVPAQSLPTILASLYTETVQICVRRSLRLQSVADLRGKIVSLGPKGSGTEPNAVAVLAAAGVTVEEIHPRYLTFDESADSISAQTIDAAFFTAGVPHPLVERLLTDERAYVLQLDARIIKEVRSVRPYFVLSRIPSGDYPNLRRAINSVGVRACLVARPGIPQRIVRQLLPAILEAGDQLVPYLPPLEHLGPQDAVEGIASKAWLHPDALAYFRGNHVFLLRSAVGAWEKAYPALLLVFLMGGVTVYRIPLRRFLNRHSFTRAFGPVLVGVVFLLVPTSIALFYVERNVNNSFESLWESMWSIMVYMLSGFEDRAPLTALGRIIAVFGLIGGLIIGSVFTAVLAGLQIKGALMHSRQLGAVFTDHVVVLGWNAKAPGVIRELLRWGRHVAVLNPTEPDRGRSLAGEEEASRVRFLCVDLADPDSYDLARLRHARSVIVLSPDAEQPDPDYRTAVQVRRVRLFLGKHRGGGHVHLVAEVVAPALLEDVRAAGADEAVCTASLGQNLLVNCAVHHGVGRFYEDLLRMTPMTNEIYMIPVPEPFQGKSYAECYKWITSHHVLDDPVIPVGVRKGVEVDTNPIGAHLKTLNAGDQLVLMAHDPESLRWLERLRSL